MNYIQVKNTYSFFRDVRLPNRPDGRFCSLLLYNPLQLIQALFANNYLTNNCRVSVQLSTQMTLKCGKNKKSGTRATGECVTDVLAIFLRLL